MKMIQVLGTGCTKCVTLENNIKAALEKSGIQANIEKVTDVAEIAAYGIMGTPGLVVDGKVLSVGKVLEVDEIITLLEGGEMVSELIEKEEKTSCCSGKKEETSSCSCNGEKKDTTTSVCCSSKKDETSSDVSFFARLKNNIFKK